MKSAKGRHCSKQPFSNEKKQAKRSYDLPPWQNKEYSISILLKQKLSVFTLLQKKKTLLSQFYIKRRMPILRCYKKKKSSYFTFLLNAAGRPTSVIIKKNSLYLSYLQHVGIGPSTVMTKEIPSFQSCSMNRKGEIRGFYGIRFPPYRVFVPTLSIRTYSSNALCPAFMIRLQLHRKMRSDNQTVLYRHLFLDRCLRRR